MKNLPKLAGSAARAATFSAGKGEVPDGVRGVAAFQVLTFFQNSDAVEGR